MSFNRENKKSLHFALFTALKVHFITIPLKVNIGPRVSCVGGGLRCALAVILVSLIITERVPFMYIQEKEKLI